MSKEGFRRRSYTVFMRVALVVTLAATAAAQSWIPQVSTATASLRSVSAVSPAVVWASGSGGTFLRTTDAGAHWQVGKLPGAADLDFRAIRAINEQIAYLLSIGAGEKSRVYKTTDGGERWNLLYTNPDPQGFFDAIAFWDATHGILLGDPVNGRFVVMTTDDGGATWRRQKTPSALPNEGAFAASNSCLFARGTREAWFGTGGPGGARVFHTMDAGQTWSVAKTPVRNDGSSAGIFSVAFTDGGQGVAVGGDYDKPTEITGTFALTSDGGKTWGGVGSGIPPGGFRSAVAYLADRKVWIATGTSGSDFSLDGKMWKQFDTGNYNAASFISSAAGWAVGPKGAIARFKME
jgi:photosystem II stability/assembly factor-like uncharacterized protein